MNGGERRQKIAELLQNSAVPLSGQALSRQLSVSRQVIVQDIALMRAQNIAVYSTNKGYVIRKKEECSRILKVFHDEKDVEKELDAVVDLGGWVKDVFVYHKAYGVVRADINIHSRRDVKGFVEKIKSGKSSLLMNVTSGYHYHTIVAEDEQTLDLIQEKLQELGFLAKLQEYEPVNFWKKPDDEKQA
ncbi:MAG: transcription repressor NadR [Oscillospiraceae bacterium]|jgi:transcriptional regulator of NAD metabolism|nr:transcription repressor NadR [Oscillospiraceae bacterium]MDD3261525.1 transcription repressor NadR [Oscillospiraceae bacterium]